MFEKMPIPLMLNVEFWQSGPLSQICFSLYSCSMTSRLLSLTTKPFQMEINSERKEFAPIGANYFLSALTPLRNGIKMEKAVLFPLKYTHSPQHTDFDGWMMDDLRFYVLFNSVSVISG